MVTATVAGGLDPGKKSMQLWSFVIMMSVVRRVLEGTNIGKVLYLCLCICEKRISDKVLVPEL